MAPSPDDSPPRSFPTDAAHTLTLRRKKVELAIRRPAEGEVYLVDDAIALEGAVLVDGTEDPERKLTWAVTGPGEAISLEGGKPGLRLTGEGELRLTATHKALRGTVRVRSVLPRVVEILLEPDGHSDRYDVYDHAQSGRAPPGWRRPVDRKDDDPPEKTHLAAFQLGARLRARVTLGAAAALTAPATVDLVGDTKDKVGDKGTPAESEAYAGDPVVFGPADRSAGVQVQAWGQGEALDLGASRPLPHQVGYWKWRVRWGYRVRRTADGQWSAEEDETAGFRKLPDTQDLRVCTVWGPPRLETLNNVGQFEGRDMSTRDSSTVRESEYDPFHLEKVCTWASGAWNLKVDDDRSIPFQLDNRIRHHAFPDGYDGLEGRPASYWASQPRPEGSTWGSGLYYPTDDGPAMSNYGWRVLDNHPHIGGRCNQQASLIASALRTLGVQARLRYVGSKDTGGALHNTMHDPVTFTAECFDEKKLYGSWPHDTRAWNFHGIVQVDPEGAEAEPTCYDGSFSSPYGGTWPPSSSQKDWTRGGIRKHGLLAESLRTTRDLKPRGPRSEPSCLCGHPMANALSACKARYKRESGEEQACRAQGRCRYRCLYCQKDLQGDPRRCPACEKVLQGQYSEIIFYACHRCGALVSENDGRCWDCGKAPR